MCNALGKGRTYDLWIVGVVYSRICYHRHGESNPTYHLQTSSGHEYVLRKRPPGELLPGAHRVRSVCLNWVVCPTCTADPVFQLISALSRKPRPLQRGKVWSHSSLWVVTEERNYRLAQLRCWHALITLWPINCYSMTTNAIYKEYGSLCHSKFLVWWPLNGCSVTTPSLWRVWLVN